MTQANFQVFFSLGEAVGIISLVIALTQLASYRNRMIWKLEKRYRFSVVTLAIIGFLLPFAAFVISSYFNDYIWLANLLQGSAFVLLVLAFVDLLRMYTIGKRHLIVFKSKIPNYAQKRIRNYFFTIQRAIIEKQNEAATDLILDNIEALLKLASSYDPGFENRKPTNKEESEYASELLEIVFTDTSFMKYIVEIRLDFLNDFKYFEKKMPINSQLSGTYYYQICDALIKNANSYLYRQTDTYKGTSRSINVYDMFFGDIYILERAILFDSMRMFYMNREHINIPINIYAETFVRIGEKTVHTYKKSPTYYGQAIQNIRVMVEEGHRIMESIAYDSALKKLATKYKTPEYEAFEAVEQFLGKLMEPQVGYKNPKKFEESVEELNALPQAAHTESTFVALAARASFEVFEMISVVKTKNHQAFDATFDLIHFSEYKTPLMTKYHELLYKKVLEKVQDNLKGYYPMVSRPIIALFAVIDPKPDGNREFDQPTIDAWNALKLILDTTIKDAIRSNKPVRADVKDRLLAKEFLPDNITYSKFKNCNVIFYSLSRDRKKSAIKLS